MASLRGYKAFFDRALQAHLAFGGSLMMTLAAHAVGFGVTLMIWHYALGASPEAAPTFAYLTLAFATNYMMNLFLERSVGERIREGLVATDLLKPMDFQLLYLVQALSDLLFQSLYSLIVVALGLYFLGEALYPASGLAFAAALLSFGLGFLVQYGLCFVFSMGIFITTSNYGIFASRLALHQAFSGIFAPISLYPEAFKALALALPFHHIIHTPVAVYLGRISGPDLGPALLAQLAWALGLLLAGRLAFRLIISRLAIQGG